MTSKWKPFKNFSTYNRLLFPGLVKRNILHHLHSVTQNVAAMNICAQWSPQQTNRNRWSRNLVRKSMIPTVTQMLRCWHRNLIILIIASKTLTHYEKNHYRLCFLWRHFTIPLLYSLQTLVALCQKWATFCHTSCVEYTQTSPKEN